MVERHVAHRAKVIVGQYDANYGGFAAPKFPSMKLNYLLGVRASAACEIGDEGFTKKSMNPRLVILRAMAKGGSSTN